MTATLFPLHPEPVPPASQLAVLPFLSAIEGYLNGADGSNELRLTVHRVMNREGQQFLQQVCNYLGPQDASLRSGAGRLFEVTLGIMGAAFETGIIRRTRHYDSRDQLLADLQADMNRTGDMGDISRRRLSWLAIPLLGANGTPTMILFADTYRFNFFADDGRVNAIVEMCWGFCRLVDTLEEDPFPTIRNFPFEGGKRVEGSRTVYPTLQEELPNLAPPQFRRVNSFNYESYSV